MTGTEGRRIVPKIVVDESRCKACLLCVVGCPQHNIELAEHTNEMGHHPAYQIDPDKCKACRLCAIMCPDVAIKVYR